MRMPHLSGCRSYSSAGMRISQSGHSTVRLGHSFFMWRFIPRAIVRPHLLHLGAQLGVGCRARRTLQRICRLSGKFLSRSLLVMGACVARTFAGAAPRVGRKGLGSVMFGSGFLLCWRGWKPQRCFGGLPSGCASPPVRDRSRRPAGHGEQLGASPPSDSAPRACSCHQAGHDARSSHPPSPHFQLWAR